MSRAAAKRGLPVRVKMRHDQHFVEELTARSADDSIGRMLSLGQIEPDPDARTGQVPNDRMTNPESCLKNVGLIGTEMTKTANSAIECPRNLIWTFVEHGLGYPSIV